MTVKETFMTVINSLPYSYQVLPKIYSAGENKSPYFLFHGETALRKNLKF